MELLYRGQCNRWYEEIVNNMETVLSRYVSKSDVTTKQMVFRAVANENEVGHLLNGHTASKTMISLDKTKEDAGRFWMSNGPKLEDNPKEPGMREIATLMRQLALCRSDRPLSQFSSVGLDFETAIFFGRNVYAFEVIPNCPLMGFQSNKIEFSIETQFQIMGNSPIYSLYRYTRDKVWNQFDFTTKTWGGNCCCSADKYGV
ncbi:MAG: hypothetical protein ACI39H_08995 [Lachnospiraceae bacterium]